MPDWTSSVGIEVIVVNVEAWELSTRPNSLPSKMGPASMGCLNSHMVDFDRACVASSLAINSSRFSSSWAFASSMAVSRPRPIM